MKIVINKCYGGFSISNFAIYHIAKKQGMECYFFEHDYNTDMFKSITIEEAINSNSWDIRAYNVPNPQDYKLSEADSSGLYVEANKRAELIALDSRPDIRTDKYLIEVIEEFGIKADGNCAKLQIIEIPDDIEFEIEEYDGMEWISEKHRTWS